MTFLSLYTPHTAELERIPASDRDAVVKSQLSRELAKELEKYISVRQQQNGQGPFAITEIASRCVFMNIEHWEHVKIMIEAACGPAARDIIAEIETK